MCRIWITLVLLIVPPYTTYLLKSLVIIFTESIYISKLDLFFTSRLPSIIKLVFHKRDINTQLSVLLLCLNFVLLTVGK